jgi:DNA-binding CsgD family transcriptional regulator
MTDQQLLQQHGHLLTTKEREACELHNRGLSQRTIALALNISRSSVQSRLETATRKLRHAHKEHAT